MVNSRVFGSLLIEYGKTQWPGLLSRFVWGDMRGGQEESIAIIPSSCLNVHLPPPPHAHSWNSRILSDIRANSVAVFLRSEKNVLYSTIASYRVSVSQIDCSLLHHFVCVNGQNFVEPSLKHTIRKGNTPLSRSC